MDGLRWPSTAQVCFVILVLYIIVREVDLRPPSPANVVGSGGLDTISRKLLVMFDQHLG